MAYSTDDHSNNGYQSNTHSNNGSVANLSVNGYAQNGIGGDSSSISDGYGDSEFVDAEEYVSGNETDNDVNDVNGSHHREVYDDGVHMFDDTFSLPPLPGPPSPHVMQGLGSREEVRDEMKRLLDSFKQHLSFTNTYVTSLPVRRAGVGVGVGGVRQEAQIEE